MQTRFTQDQLAHPDIAASNEILRTCVHCGFCNATCPTYALLGDELDGPRGRIYLIKEMLEQDRPPSETDVKHVDRCLSCLACMTTCPSGVNYMHLVDHARRHIETTHRRAWTAIVLREALGRVLPNPALFRRLLSLGRLARPIIRYLPGTLGRLASLLPMRQGNVVSPPSKRTVYPAVGAPKYRVVLLAGCVQQDLAPQINAATIRLLTRHGCEVVTPEGAGCCGALTQHLGQTERAIASARVNVAAWQSLIEDDGLDAIIVNASGCGTMVKDYGYLFRNDPEWTDEAAEVAGKARDVSEFLDEIGIIGAGDAKGLRIAYQSACSLQHGQGVRRQPIELLKQCGFDVVEPADAHLCCGSAGTYNILQGEIADRLRDQKIAALAAVAPNVIASGNIGCMMQLSAVAPCPVVHTAELLDWATGGPRPAAIEEAG